MQSPKFGAELAFLGDAGSAGRTPEKPGSYDAVAEAGWSPGTQPGGGAGRATAHPVPEGEFAPVTS